MIEGVIFIGLAIIISEVLFFKLGSSDSWLSQKMFLLCIGISGSFILFWVPNSISFNCSFFGDDLCINKGGSFFFWYYGVIIGIFLFFWSNWKLINYKEKRNKLKGKENA